MELYWPATNGEWLAWGAATVTVLLGLVGLFLPRLLLRFMGLVAAGDPALAEVRASYGGFRLGLGLSCLLLHPQPLLYLGLGIAWAATLFGRVLSMLSDRGLTIRNWLALVLEAALAAGAFAYALSFVP